MDRSHTPRTPQAPTRAAAFRGRRRRCQIDRNRRCGGERGHGLPRLTVMAPSARQPVGSWHAAAVLGWLAALTASERSTRSISRGCRDRGDHGSAASYAFGVYAVSGRSGATAHAPPPPTDSFSRAPLHHGHFCHHGLCDAVDPHEALDATLPSPYSKFCRRQNTKQRSRVWPSVQQPSSGLDRQRTTFEIHWV